jgi:hypothetical protein
MEEPSAQDHTIGDVPISITGQVQKKEESLFLMTPMSNCSSIHMCVVVYFMCMSFVLSTCCVYMSYIAGMLG